MKKSILAPSVVVIIFLSFVMLTSCSTLSKLSETPPYRAENGFINDRNSNVVCTYGMGLVKDKKGKVIGTYSYKK